MSDGMTAVLDQLEESASVSRMPDEFNSIISEAVDRHPDDIGAAHEMALEAILELDSIEDIKRIAVSRATLGAIHDRRHQCNRITAQKALRDDDVPAESELQADESDVQPQQQRSRPRSFAGTNGADGRLMLDYMLGGMRLRNATHEHLTATREKLKGDAIGVVRDMMLCDALLARVKPGETVSQHVNEDDAVRLFKEASEMAVKSVGKTAGMKPSSKKPK